MEIHVLNTKVKVFIQSLEVKCYARVLKTLDLLKCHGHNLRMPHSKVIEHNLLELRIPGEQNIRLFYTFHFGKAVIIHGFIKKADRLLIRELEIARNVLKHIDNT